MKILFSAMVLASAVAVAQQAAPEPSLKPGSEVSLAPFAEAKWVQGEPLTAFEPGKVYMFECWATWCGPCIAAIPHVNELHQKYHDQGLRVYGMNVWEDGFDKVEKFVKSKGDGMSYPVAYTGKGSAFETDWLKAAGVRGIPHAFIVKDGKILLTSHPSQLTDSVIEALLSGDEGAEKAVQKINSAKENQAKIGTVMREFRMASGKKDAEAMAEQIATLKELDPESRYLAPMNLELLLAKKDWAAATKTIEESMEGPEQQMMVTMTAQQISRSTDSDFPAEFISTVSKAYGKMIASGKRPTGAMDLVTLANLEWKAGDKKSALANAEKSAKLAENPKGGRPMPVEPFERYAKSVEDGEPASMRDFSKWLSDALRKKAAASKAKAAPAQP